MSGYITREGARLRSNGSPGGEQMMSLMMKMDRQERRNREICRDYLIGRGVKLATPNDGWVNREKLTVTPPHYALFQVGNPQAGDIIALGSATHEEAIAGSFKLARITAVTKTLLGHSRYSFEWTGENISVPAQEQKP
jgi:hypothetical protein